MDDDVTRELRALQARAYGPHPDIDDDPAARGRLAELEALTRRARRGPLAPPVRPGPPPPLPADLPAATTTLRDAAAPATTTTARSSGPATAEGARARRILTGVTWVGSLAAVATIAVAGTAMVTARTAWTGTAVTPGSDVRHVATLQADGERGLPEFFGPRSDDATAYEEFFGVVPMTGTVEFPGSSAVCLQIVDVASYETESDQGWNGLWFNGCGFAPFATNVSLPVSADAPTALRERFPAGTRLQFVVEDGAIEVFASEPVSAEAAG